MNWTVCIVVSAISPKMALADHFQLLSLKRKNFLMTTLAVVGSFLQIQGKPLVWAFIYYLYMLDLSRFHNFVFTKEFNLTRRVELETQF